MYLFLCISGQKTCVLKAHRGGKRRPSIQESYIIYLAFCLLLPLLPRFFHKLQIISKASACVSAPVWRIPFASFFLKKRRDPPDRLFPPVWNRSPIPAAKRMDPPAADSLFRIVPDQHHAYLHAHLALHRILPEHTESFLQEESPQIFRGAHWAEESNASADRAAKRRDPPSGDQLPPIPAITISSAS